MDKLGAGLGLLRRLRWPFTGPARNTAERLEFRPDSEDHAVQLDPFVT
jgi:hypothetical protein